MGREVLSRVRDWLWDPPKDPGQVGGPSRRSGTGRGTLPKVWEGLGTLLVVHDGSGDPP